MRARALILSLLLLASPAAWAEALWTEVQQLRNDQGYADASAWRRAQLRAVVADLTRSAATGVVPASARRRVEAAGMMLREGDDWIIVSSRPDQADGFYVIRKGGAGPALVLEAPHAWFDLDTGRLACALFEAGYGRALLINTAQRNAPSQGDLAAHAGQLGADVAHRAESAFQAATLGVVDALSDPLVVQLHGMGGSHGAWSAVVSEGSTFQPASWVTLAEDELDPVLGRWGAIASGEEVPDLAGRTNVQSRALTGTARFLHVELALAPRRALVADDALLNQLGAALDDLAERPR